MSATQEAQPYTKDNPFPARLTENRLLNKPGSAKETRHIVIDFTGSGLRYKAGDSIGVYPANNPADVTEILQRLGASGEELVNLPKDTAPVSLLHALSNRLSIAGPTVKFLGVLATAVTNPAEKARLDELLLPANAESTKAFLEQREFVDLLAEFPSAKFTPQAFVDNLRRLAPRLYSIASSPYVSPEACHTTIAIVRYTTNNRKRGGVASTYLADRAGLNIPSVPVFIANSHFGLPEDPATDIIMVGPGTGIAPFRAFVQERDATKAPGRNWLFFGDQSGKTDFLYEDEWKHYLAKGTLTRLDTAWSRDQAHKIYVQDKMREASAELWKWIQAGAAFYVCGDAKRMAKDVDAALHEIIAKEGGMTPEQAADYVKQMKKDKRYQRDVY
jgi:sulfite reductase (NADPH) flavoprotein alpha-component